MLVSDLKVLFVAGCGKMSFVDLDMLTGWYASDDVNQLKEQIRILKVEEQRKQGLFYNGSSQIIYFLYLTYSANENYIGSLLNTWFYIQQNSVSM